MSLQLNSIFLQNWYGVVRFLTDIKLMSLNVTLNLDQAGLSLQSIY
jgi:hypothetical protein